MFIANISIEQFVDPHRSLHAVADGFLKYLSVKLVFFFFFLGMTDNFFVIKLQKDKTRSLQYFCKLRYLFPEVMSFMNKKTEDQSMSLYVGNT